jgi:hypothetical protein
MCCSEVELDNTITTKNQQLSAQKALVEKVQEELKGRDAVITELQDRYSFSILSLCLCLCSSFETTWHYVS